MSKTAVFTIDVEKFSDITSLLNRDSSSFPTMLDGLDTFLAICEKHGIKADLFVLGEHIDSMRDTLLKAILNGHRINVHGWKHVAPTNQELETFKSDIERTVEVCKSKLDVVPLGYRAPDFCITKDQLKTIKDLGFAFDASFTGAASFGYDNGINHENSLENIGFFDEKFREFPINCSHTGKLKGMPVSGGGYMRLIPWAISRGLIKRVIRHDDLFVFYCHPFELSKEKAPSIKGQAFRDSFYQSAGRKSFAKKIEYLINSLKKNGFVFKTFEELI